MTYFMVAPHVSAFAVQSFGELRGLRVDGGGRAVRHCAATVGVEILEVVQYGCSSLRTNGSDA